MNSGVSKWTIAAICVSEVAVGIAVWFIPADLGQRLVNIITAVGTCTSLIAFVVMLQQFESVRLTTENVKKEVNKIVSIADLSQYAERVRTVYGDICEKEYKLAAFKLESVREALVSIRSKVMDPTKVQQYTKAISTISTTKTALQEKGVIEEDLNMGRIAKDLEKVVAFLQEEKYEMVKQG